MIAVPLTWFACSSIISILFSHVVYVDVVESTRADMLSATLYSSIGQWGNWGAEAICPANTWAVGFQLKVEPKQGAAGDDTAANGLRLACAPRKWASDSQIIMIEASNDGEWGSWGTLRTCPYGSYAHWFQTRVEAFVGNTKDDTALNDVRFKCSDGPSPYTEFRADNGLEFGSWGALEHCPREPSFVCGFKQKVEANVGAKHDDTALNAIGFRICDQDNNWEIAEPLGEWQQLASCANCASSSYSVMQGTKVTDTSGTETTAGTEYSSALSAGIEAGFLFGKVTAGVEVGGSVSQQTSVLTQKSVMQETQTTLTVTCAKQFFYQWVMSASGDLGPDTRNFNVASENFLCTDVQFPKCPLGVSDNDADYQTCPSFQEPPAGDGDATRSSAHRTRTEL